MDAGSRTTAVDHGVRLGIGVQCVQRPPGIRGFTIMPRRWTIECSFGWLMHHRRLARGYERYPHRSQAMIHLAKTNSRTPVGLFTDEIHRPGPALCLT